MMEQVLGPIPEAMVERSNKAASKCFVENRCARARVRVAERAGPACLPAMYVPFKELFLTALGCTPFLETISCMVSGVSGL